MPNEITAVVDCCRTSLFRSETVESPIPLHLSMRIPDAKTGDGTSLQYLRSFGKLKSGSCFKLDKVQK